MLGHRISKLFSALIPSPSNNSNTNMSSSTNNNCSPNSCHDDEMSADLLSQESQGRVDTSDAEDVSPRPPTRKNTNSLEDATEEVPMKSNRDEAGRPSFQSNAGTCHSTKKFSKNDNRYGAPAHKYSSQVEHNNAKKLEEPWRNYGKSYARHSARNPANTATKKDIDNNIYYNNEAAVTAKSETNKSPPSSKKKKTHKLMLRLQQHSNKLQQNNSPHSSHSSTKMNYHDQRDNGNPTSLSSKKGRPTFNNQLIYTSPAADNSLMGQEIEIVDRSNDGNDDEREYYEEFSPLTCTISSQNVSRAGFNVYGSDDNEEEEDDDVGNMKKTTNEVNNDEASGEAEEGRGELKNDQDYESSKAASDPTLIKNYNAALNASNPNNNVDYNKSNSNNANIEKRGTKRKPTALDLALIEESTTNILSSKNTGTGRNNRRNKFKALDAALAEKEDSQTPPYDVPTPRYAEEGKNEEMGEDIDDKDESMGGNEVDFFTSNDGDENEDEKGESSGTDKQSEALLSSPSGKQSEALLSSSSTQPKTTAANSTANVAAPGTNQITTDELVLNLRDICENLGKALTCPICQCCLREAQLLPCCHAFCKSCLAKTFNPSRSNSKGKKKGSPPPTAFKHCPTCKKPADRRSAVPIPQLDEQVKAYKQVLRVFGIVPIVHGEGIAMTQLDPEDDGELLNEEDYRQCLQASRTVNDVLAREKEKVEAKVAAVATSTARKPSMLLTHPLRRPRSFPQSQHQQRLTKEQMQSQHEMRRWQQVTKEQQNVVKVNEDALNKVKGQAHKLVNKKMVQAETAKFLATANNSDGSKTLGANKNVDGAAVDGTEKSDDEDLDFCTAPDGDSLEYDTAKESQGLSTTITTADACPMVINDGNTVKKAERSLEDRPSKMPGSCVLDLEVSPEAQKNDGGRVSFGTVSTGIASPIVLHDGNTVRKTRPSNEEDKTPRISNNFSRGQGVAVMRASNSAVEDEDDVSDYAADTKPLIKDAPLKSGGNVGDESDYCAETQPLIGKESAKPPADSVGQKPAAATAIVSTSRDEPVQREKIVKGSIVMVESRTWPGINKHGGVGRVTKVHSSSTSGGSAVQYDVSYVLGGKEKFVDESFVHLHKTNDEETSSRVSSARKPRKSSEKKLDSRRPKRTQQKVTFKEEVRIYNEEELKHIPAEALEWAGIVPKKSKSKKKAGAKKRALTDSNPNMKPAASSKKKQKTVATASAKNASKKAPKAKTAPKSNEEIINAGKETDAAEVLMAMAHGGGDSATLNEMISHLTTEEILQNADERYSSLLLSNENRPLVLNVVTSNLSEEELESLNSLCKLLKDRRGKICSLTSSRTFLDVIVYSHMSPRYLCIQSLLEAFEKFQGE